MTPTQALFKIAMLFNGIQEDDLQQAERRALEIACTALKPYGVIWQRSEHGTVEIVGRIR